MLEELSVKDYALIETLTVEFEHGFNVLSGETGAGKSIVVGALGFLLGAKADADAIRGGADETRVSATVHIDENNRYARLWLSDHSLEADDGRVLIRRSMRRNGRGSIYVQEAAISRAELIDFAGRLFDMHGQRDQENLLKPENHRRYLDRFAGAEEQAEAFNLVFTRLAEEKRLLAEADARRRDKALRQEMLEYAISEINAAGIKADESENLEAEAAKLGSFEKLSTAVNAASECLYENENSALAELRRTKNHLAMAKEADPSLSALSDRLAALFYDAEDAANELRGYSEQLNFDPKRLDAIQERLAVLFRLKKKYGVDEKAILDYRSQAIAELEKLSQSESNRNELIKTISALEREALERAALLSEKRTKAAALLAKRVSSVLAELGMPKARFEVLVTPKSAADGVKKLGSWGAEDIQFYISANLGEAVKDLSKVASGGELSRIMLAIKTILADSDTAETLIFDEIDAGIGGEVALAVGERLEMVAQAKQIFCVTHLASIAVRADNHLVVEKKTSDGRTKTTITRLEAGNRRAEIARMLAGDAAGSAALAHADALLAHYGKRG